MILNVFFVGDTRTRVDLMNLSNFDRCTAFFSLGCEFASQLTVSIKSQSETTWRTYMTCYYSYFTGLTETVKSFALVSQAFDLVHFILFAIWQGFSQGEKVGLRDSFSVIDYIEAISTTFDEPDFDFGGFLFIRVLD